MICLNPKVLLAMSLFSFPVYAQVVPDCCSFTFPTEQYRQLTQPIKIGTDSNQRVEFTVHGQGGSPCLFTIPQKPAPFNCAIVETIHKIWNCTTCVKQSDLTETQKAASKAEEAAYYGTTNVTRISEPTIKQDCHGATMQVNYRVQSIPAFIELRNHQETTDPELATFCTHNSNDHSSYNIESGMMMGVGCDGQPAEYPATFVTGKFGWGSKLRMPLVKVREGYPVVIRYDK